MQRMWRRMFAAAAGVLAAVGMAAAQSPNPLPPIPAGQVAPVTPASGAVRVQGAGGCANCGPAVPYGQYGPGQRNGCGSYRHDAGFIFGSCKSFFNPCGPLPCEGLGRFRGPCSVAPHGKPYGNGLNPCVYDSFAHH